MEYGETMFADMTNDELQSFVSPGGMIAPEDDNPHTFITSESIRERRESDIKKRGDV